LQATHEPIAIDQGGPDAFGQRLRRPGILDEMMMEGDHPARLWKLPADNCDAAGLFHRDHAKGVREGEMRIGVRVQQDDAETVIPIGRQHHRKYPAPQLRQLLCQARPSGISKSGHAAEMWLQRRCQSFAESAARSIDDTNTRSLDGCHAGQRPHLAQSLVPTSRQVEPCRVCGIDDIEVVVARHHQHDFCEPGMLRDSVEEFSPLGRQAGVGHVAGDQNGMERVTCVERLQPRKHLSQSLVAARTRSAALDPEAVTLADDVNVRQMCDAPLCASVWRRVEPVEVARRIHRRIGNAPDQCGHCDIGAHEHDAVGQRHDCEVLRGAQDRDIAPQMRARPGEHQDQQRDRTDQSAGAYGGGCMQRRALDASVTR
jgi:hypothetical protein